MIEQSNPSGKVDGIVLQTKSYFPSLKILITWLIISISTSGQSPVILKIPENLFFFEIS